MIPKEGKGILAFKLSPCCSNDELSSGYFPRVWVLPPVEDGTDTVFRNVGF